MNVICIQVRREFKAIVSFEDDVHSMMDNWLEWREKIIKFAKKESVTRPLLKKLLQHLEKCHELLYPHGQCNIAF